MKASSDNNKDCLPWGLRFYLVGFALSKLHGGTGALPHEKSVQFQEGRRRRTALRCSGHLAPSVEPSAGPLVSNTKGGYRGPMLRVRHELTKLN